MARSVGRNSSVALTSAASSVIDWANVKTLGNPASRPAGKQRKRVVIPAKCSAMRPHLAVRIRLARIRCSLRATANI